MNMKKRQAVTKKESPKRKQSMTKDMLRNHLESMFPPDQKLISRRDHRLNEIIAGGSLANADSEGNGIAERIIIGNKTFYERMATINWLVDRAKE
jgi:hypothetical protein